MISAALAATQGNRLVRLFGIIEGSTRAETCHTLQPSARHGQMPLHKGIGRARRLSSKARMVVAKSL